MTPNESEVGRGQQGCYFEAQTRNLTHKRESLPLQSHTVMLMSVDFRLDTFPLLP